MGNRRKIFNEIKTEHLNRNDLLSQSQFFEKTNKVNKPLVIKRYWHKSEEKKKVVLNGKKLTDEDI